MGEDGLLALSDQANQRLREWISLKDQLGQVAPAELQLEPSPSPDSPGPFRLSSRPLDVLGSPGEYA